MELVLRDALDVPDTDLDCDGLLVPVELVLELFDDEIERLDVEELDGDRVPRLDGVYDCELVWDADGESDGDHESLGDPELLKDGALDADSDGVGELDVESDGLD